MHSLKGIINTNDDPFRCAVCSKSIGCGSDSFLFTCQFFILLLGILFSLDGLKEDNLRAFFFLTLTVSLVASAILTLYEAPQKTWLGVSLLTLF